MVFSYIYLSKCRKRKHKRGYKIVNRKRWRFIIIDMRHLFIMERSEEKREEKGKGKREKGKGKRKKEKREKGRG